MTTSQGTYTKNSYQLEKPTINVVLVEPKIPQNTGSVGRTVASINGRLHVVGPTAFEITEKKVRRAGLDYWPYLDIKIYENTSDFFHENKLVNQNSEDYNSKVGFYGFSKYAEELYTEQTYKTGDYLVFGSETEGLPRYWHNLFECQNNKLLKIPMYNDKVRCLNLSNAVSIGVFEALRVITS